MRILGIDFGEKRIGLAISDPLGFTAQGLETLANESRGQVLEALSKICKEREVREVVIGLPVNMNGSLGPKAKEVMELASELEKKLGLAVKTWDERLTSQQVNRLMIEADISRGKQKKNVDRLAATVILQSYLESKRHG
jgi:putative Holliday junction resolvase